MYEYYAKVLRVIDGDTVDALIDLGFDIHVNKRIRLEGINAWESRTRDLEVKKKGLLAKERLVQLLESNQNNFRLVSYGVGKFGRCIGRLYIDTYDHSVNDILVSEGHAKIYKV